MISAVEFGLSSGGRGKPSDARHSLQSLPSPYVSVGLSPPEARSMSPNTVCIPPGLLLDSNASPLSML